MPSLSHLTRRAFLTLAVSLVASFAVVAAPVSPLRIMSFNGRYSAAKDGDNAWSRRVDHFFAVIARFDPDLIGFPPLIIP